VLAVLAVTVVVAYRWVPDWGRVALDPLVALGLVWVARSSGSTWEQLGLARARVAAGIRWGLGAAAAVAAGVLVLAALPVARDVLYGEAVLGQPASAVVVAAAVRIPLGTVVPEELVFRGVLLALLLRHLSDRRALLGSASLFALWHVAVILATGRDLPALGVLAGTAAQAGAFALALGSTFAAGLGFGWLRLRSGSLAAPVLAHWATNGLMLLAAYVMAP
jgi:membrane protease YdiL (CAAX protease family)